MKHFCLYIGILFLAACTNNNQKLTGPYLGQHIPGDTPQLFAPGIINDGISTRDLTFTPDGKEIYFGKNIGNFSFSTILFCKVTEDGWSKPEVVSFAQNPEYIFIEPFISPDGKKLFFVSNKGKEIKADNKFSTDIWVAERKGENWGNPYKLGFAVNSLESEFYPTVAESGNLYFTREDSKTRQNYIYKSELTNGEYQKAEKLPIQVNCGRGRYNTTISKDERFMIIPSIGMPDTYGGTDYYISFYDNRNGWSEPQNLGDKINTPSTHEYSAGFSPDGKFFFFMSARTKTKSVEKLTLENLKKLHNSPESGNSNIYWMRADFIKDLKEKAIFTKN